MDASSHRGPTGGGAHPTVSVIGLGYIGLATACIFSSVGVPVIGVDIDEDVVTSVNDGVAHFCERSIADLLRRGVAAGLLSAVSTPVEADVFVLAVPTPIDPADRPDMSYLDSAALSVAPVLRPGNLVILESTSPVGTTRRIAKLIAAERPDLACNINQDRADGISFAFCPERVIPGNMLEELVNNDRVVGGLTPGAAEAAAAIYRTFLAGACHTTTAEMAEMVKLAENAFRDVNLAYANELWHVCQRLGLDPYDLIAMANRHPRVSILTPGPGVGGHCIAVDPWFIVDSAPDATPLLRAARAVNDDKPHKVVSHVQALCYEHGWRKLLCVGLTYKADVDDFRGSPALTIATELTRLWGRNVACADPHAAALRTRGGGQSLLTVDLEAGLAWADAALCLVNHACYADALRASTKPIIDVCGRRNAARKPQLRLAGGRAALEQVEAGQPAA
jgi:UDP-N-acetyl-D-mannosaminuronic acid dehydrogenase